MAVVGYVADRDANFEALVIHEPATDDTLEIQRAFRFDDQDTALGMAGYCLVHEGAVHYGGVTEWSLALGKLQLRLEGGAARNLELQDVVTVELDAQSADLVQQHLERLLAAGR